MSNGLEVITRRKKEDQEYLVLCTTPDEEYHDWYIVTGRKNVYNFIKENIDNIRPKLSYVISESASFSERITVLDFILYCQERLGYNDDFDIYEYEENSNIQDNQPDPKPFKLDGENTNPFTGVMDSNNSNIEDI